MKRNWKFLQSKQNPLESYESLRCWARSAGFRPVFLAEKLFSGPSFYGASKMRLAKVFKSVEEVPGAVCQQIQILWKHRQEIKSSAYVCILDVHISFRCPYIL